MSVKALRDYVVSDLTYARPSSRRGDRVSSQDRKLRQTNRTYRHRRGRWHLERQVRGLVQVAAARGRSEVRDPCPAGRLCQRRIGRLERNQLGYQSITRLSVIGRHGEATGGPTRRLRNVATGGREKTRVRICEAPA